MFADMEYKVVTSQRGKSLIFIGGYTYCMGASQRIWVCSTKMPQCKARIRLDDEGRILEINDEHPHPKRKYIQTKDGTFVPIHSRLKKQYIQAQDDTLE
jgi:hypothetical protein